MPQIMNPEGGTATSRRSADSEGVDNQIKISKGDKIKYLADEELEPMSMDTTLDDQEPHENELFCYATLFPDDIADAMDDKLLAFKAVSDPDTLYLHQAMKQDDKNHFIEAMKKEVRDQSHNGNFSIIHRSMVPKGTRILPAVW